MSVTVIPSAHIIGLSGEEVSVEVDVSKGLYSFSIVGLPDKAIDESKDRIIAALKNSGVKNPKQEGHKVTVSLTPSNIKKEGSHFDVPIAISYLIASKQLKSPTDISWFVGELSLTGEILPMNGILLIAECAKRLGIKSLYVPYKNKGEASIVDGVSIYGCKTLSELIIHLGGRPENNDPQKLIKQEQKISIPYKKSEACVDFKDIQGQENAKRALQIAASGGHNIALYGPPGTGKTMLARAFTGILPPLNEREIIEVNKIHSLMGKTKDFITHPPLRSPHHTSSYVSLVGGGTNPKPGEVTLAHRGVLFLDEFPEFDKKVIESLREPLEEGVITVSRAKGSYSFPASCTLIASMNPCPCGYFGSNTRQCVCKRSDIDKYVRKLSGPIVDRIDMWVPVMHINYETLTNIKNENESSDSIQKRVTSVRGFAIKRFNKKGELKINKNKDMNAKDIQKYVTLSNKTKDIMKKLSEKYSLSPRSYHRVLRLARTIADYRFSENVEERDILEAFQYRPKLYENL